MTTFRPHPLAALEPALRTLFAFGALAAMSVLAADSTSLVSNWIGYTELIIGFVVAFLPAVRVLFTSYEVNESGLRARTAMLATTEQKVPWEKVTLLRHKRTLLDTIFGLEHLDVVAYRKHGATVRIVGLRRNSTMPAWMGEAMRKNSSIGALLRAD